MPIYRLPAEPLFPPVSEAEPDGLLAVGGDLSPQRLLAAYAQGIFPWYSEGEPILWWSPDPRLVLEPAALHLPRSLAKVLRRGTYRITFDTAFDQVMAACAGVREENGGGTWITPEMRAAYGRLHQLGHAHSVEAWLDPPEDPPLLAGGLYGIALGGCFFGESMFFRRPDASKAAFVTLVRTLDRLGFTLIDCQQTTHHLVRFGAHEIPRHRFLSHLHHALRRPLPPGSWGHLAPVPGGAPP